MAERGEEGTRGEQGGIGVTAGLSTRESTEKTAKHVWVEDRRQDYWESRRPDGQQTRGDRAPGQTTRQQTRPRHSERDACSLPSPPLPSLRSLRPELHEACLCPRTPVHRCSSAQETQWSSTTAALPSRCGPCLPFPYSKLLPLPPPHVASWAFHVPQSELVLSSDDRRVRI